MGSEREKKKDQDIKKNRWGKKRNEAKQGVSKISEKEKGSKQGFNLKFNLDQINNLNPVKSVGVKLFLIFFCAIVTCVLLLGLMSYNKAKSTIQHNAANANMQTIIQTSDKLDIILKQYEDMILQIFFDNEMQTSIESLGAPNQDAYSQFVLTDKITKKLSNQINSNSSIKAIYLIPSDEKVNPVVAGTSGIDLSTMRDDASYKQVTSSNQSVWIPSSKTKDGNMTFKLARSLQSLSGGKSYVLMMELNTAVIEDQLQTVDLGNGGKLELISAEGQVSGASIEGLAGEESDFAFMKEQKEEMGGLNTKDETGHSVVAVYNTLKKTGWKLVGTVPTEVLVKDAKGILSLTLWSALVYIIIAILVGWWMVLMIARPLKGLKDLMLEGSKGNLKVRTTHKSGDEIGQLGQSFNLMMDQITKLVQQTNTTAQQVLDTAGELSDASKKTALSAKEIATATEEIANGATSLATEAERGNELTDHILSQMHMVVTTNEEMGSAARHVEQSSELGTKHLSDLLDKTHQTEDMTRTLMNKVDGLKETTMSVNKVLDVLQNITKQTNILSLNATIEAARAGAAGKGFMVVADEIRMLADQSRQSIEMVGEITGKIMNEMNETVEALADAHPLFQHQMNAVKETNEIFVSVQQQMADFTQRLDSVTTSIETLNQSQGILSEAMGNVSAVAEESSATSEEVASLSNEQQSIGDQLVQLSGKLENVSNDLKETLARFTI